MLATALGGSHSHTNGLLPDRRVSPGHQIFLVVFASFFCCWVPLFPIGKSCAKRRFGTRARFAAPPPPISARALLRMSQAWRGCQPKTNGGWFGGQQEAGVLADQAHEHNRQRHVPPNPSLLLPFATGPSPPQEIATTSSLQSCPTTTLFSCRCAPTSSTSVTSTSSTPAPSMARSLSPSWSVPSLVAPSLALVTPPHTLTPTRTHTCAT